MKTMKPYMSSFHLRNFKKWEEREQRLMNPTPIEVEMKVIIENGATLADLIQVAVDEGIPVDQVRLAGGSAQWRREETPEERSARVVNATKGAQIRYMQRKEAYLRMKAEFEPDDPKDS